MSFNLHSEEYAYEVERKKERKKERKRCSITVSGN